MHACNHKVVTTRMHSPRELIAMGSKNASEAFAIHDMAGVHRISLIDQLKD